MTEEYWSWPMRGTLAMWGLVEGMWAGIPLALPLGGTALETPGLVVLAALIGAGFWRGLTVRVAADEAGLLVRNVFRTYRVAWQDVTELGWCDVWETRFQDECPYVRVRGRRGRVRLVAMTTMGLWGSRQVDASPRFTAAVAEWRSREIVAW